MSTLWWLLGSGLVGLGAFFAYAGARLLLAGHPQAGAGVAVMGLVLGLWGIAVLSPCYRRTSRIGSREEEMDGHDSVHGRIH